MTDDSDTLFEQRLRSLLAKVGVVKGRELTAERLERLRALVPMIPAEMPTATLLWRRMGDGITETLSILKTVGLFTACTQSSLLRDGKTDGTRFDRISFPVQDGELLAQVIPGENRSAKVLLSVKGSLAERDDLSVELLLGKRLIEARPLEQKAEVTITGSGDFSIALFAGESSLGTMRLDIGAEEDSGNA